MCSIIPVKIHESASMIVSKETLEEAIANCDKEQIHIPGSIQSFGYLLATNRTCETIDYVSANFEDVLGNTPVNLLERSFDDSFPSHFIHEVRNALGRDTSKSQREPIGTHEINGKVYQGSAHLSDGCGIVELFPMPEDGSDEIVALDQVRHFLGWNETTSDPIPMLETTVERLQALTGYDRVSAYRFLPDHSGEIVAEKRRPSVPSFLGLRFPATDIPPIARKLYATTPIRIIGDVSETPVPILSAQSGFPPLNLSLAVLRGTSPVHLQYLKNMGVRATLTLSIVVGGNLWGLVTFHHHKPKILPSDTLLTAELVGKLLSLRIQHLIETQRQDTLRNCVGVASKLIIEENTNLLPGNHWADVRSDLMKLIQSDGILFRHGESLEAHGSCPPQPSSQTLLDHIDPGDAPVAYNNLKEHFPSQDWGQTGGALIVQLNDKPKVVVAFLRNCIEHSIDWAGTPEKEIEVSEHSLQLAPRRSFELYKQTVSDRSDEWTQADLEVAQSLQNAAAQVNAPRQHLADNNLRLNLMVRELNHRVMNILSLVQSLAVRTKQAATSVEDYAKTLEQRIIALAGAHNLLTLDELSGARMHDLVEQELRPYMKDLHVTGSDGPDVHFRHDAAPVIVLVIHELTSNAVKHGALSVEGGKVAVNWKYLDNGLEIRWQETNGPIVQTPSRDGFGRSIIESAIPYELNGKAVLGFEPSGIEARFWLPGDVLTEARGALPDAPAFRKTVAAPANPPLAKRWKRALIVEDNYLIAIQAKHFLEETFFTEATTVSTCGLAMHMIEEEEFDFCLLDVNVRNQISIPVARLLKDKCIPFVFSTGYSSGSDVISTFGAKVITKPFDTQILHQVISEMLHTGGTQSLRSKEPLL